MSDPRLLRLRVELYFCAQMLTGDDAEEFWTLIHEIVLIRKAEDSAARKEVKA